MISSARITAIGTYVPEQILTNEQLSEMVETNNEWIVQRTGMIERRIAKENEFTSTMAIKAIENLLHRYSLSIQTVDCIIVTTTTADYTFPSVASQIQEFFNISHTGAFDLNAACAGFTYSLHVANGLISSGLHQKVLVVASETMSKVTDYTDRSTCVLFGDGAAAILVERDEENPSFLASHLGTDGTGGQHLYRANLAQSMHGKPLASADKIVQNGREVYKWAVSTVPQGIHELLAKAKMNRTDVDWFVPHSANLRMIESICEKSGLPIDQTLVSVEYMGNTSSASIPLALDIGLQNKKLRKGDTLLLYGFGGGLTHCGLLLKWNL